MVGGTQARGQQDLHRLAKQFILRVPEQCFSLTVDQRDDTSTRGDHDRIRCRFDQATELDFGSAGRLERRLLRSFGPFANSAVAQQPAQAGGVPGAIAGHRHGQARVKRHPFRRLEA